MVVRTKALRRARTAATGDDRRRIVALLSESRVSMSAAEVAAIIWGPGSPPQRATHHLVALQGEGRVRRIDRRWKA